MKTIVSLLSIIVLLNAGCDVFLDDVGGRGQPCMDNGVCNEGLFCVDNVCVKNPCDLDICNGHGTCSDGVCTCNTGYAGIACDGCAPGYYGYPDCVCLGRGDSCSVGNSFCCPGLVCDVLTNKCFDACQSASDCRSRTEIQFHNDLECKDGICDFYHCEHDANCQPGKICRDGNCITWDVCENIDPSCSGHGTCSSGTCICDTGYTGYLCNQCDTGYVGYPDCVDDACDPDPCSGHGTCSGGSCTCYTGYSGAECNQCATGYVGYPNCIDDPCDPDPCNGHGACEEGACVCDIGYTGSWCDSCAPGFTGYPNCRMCFSNSDCPPGRPVCADGFCWSVKCLWDGQCPAGQKCVYNSCRPACNTQADCMSSGTVCDPITTSCIQCQTEDVSCDPLCQVGTYCVETTCVLDICDPPCGDELSCVEGYCVGRCSVGEKCAQNFCTDVCTSNADCSYPTPICNSNVGVCVECYTDDDCDSGEKCLKNLCIPGCNVDIDCGGSLICDMDAGDCYLDCIDDSDCPLSQVCESEKCIFGCGEDRDCLQDFICLRSSDEPGSCVRDPCPSNSCSGHGTCSRGICNCDTGYAGVICDGCAAGYIGYPMCVDDPCDPDPCYGHGTCTGGICTCDAQYSGQNCDECEAGAFGEYPNCFLPGEGYCDTNQCFLVPTSNQSLCYDNSSSMVCTAFPCNANGSPDFCGQDAQYPDNIRTFTCYSEGGTQQDPCDYSADEGEVVIDSLTGLIWQRTFTTSKTWQEALDYCENLVYASYSDWRLPNPFELQNIVDYGRYSPTIDTEVFPGTPSYGFWSSSSYASDSSSAWFVSFDVPVVYDTAKSDVMFVRCVRPGYDYSSSGGGCFAVSEPIAGQQLVQDAVTGLIWQKGFTTAKTWQEALSYCEGLFYGGFSDWRLPSNKELLSLVNYGRYSPASDFPDMPLNWFWSSSSCAHKPSDAWNVTFSNGLVNFTDKSYTSAVRCVRPGLSDDPCDPDPCNGHGICAGGVCTCNTGYSGEACDQCDPAFGSYPNCDECVVGAFGEYPYCFLPATGYCDTSQCFRVPPTNQINCYDNTSSMTCPAFPCNMDGSPDFCGQDAQYPDNERIFACYNADGTEQNPCDSSADEGEVVVDSQTGITWQRIFVTGKTWQDAVDYCDNLVYAGYDDWRLPNPFELQTIVDDGRYNPSIDTGVFPATPPIGFHSSLSFVCGTSSAWAVGFYVGDLALLDKNNQCGVRCMRLSYSFLAVGGSRFTVSEPVAGEQIVYDSVTGLLWQKSGATGITWQAALSYCEGLDYGGYSDWRLPDKKELLILVNYRRCGPASDFPDTPSSWFWSSSSYVLDPSNAWTVDLGNGYDYGDGMNKTDFKDVRCVRTGP